MLEVGYYADVVGYYTSCCGLECLMWWSFLCTVVGKHFLVGYYA